jgi:hypothetical protein
MRHFVPVLLALSFAACGGSKSSGTTPSVDMTASVDMTNPVCQFPSGDICDPDIGCSNGCSWCACTINGTSTHGAASCNENACVPGDSGAIFDDPCTTTADCAGGLVCVWSIGCTQTHGKCTPSGACNSFGVGNPPVGTTTFCDCNHHTVTVDTTCGIPQQYAHVGGCG